MKRKGIDGMDLIEPVGKDKGNNETRILDIAVTLQDCVDVAGDGNE